MMEKKSELQVLLGLSGEDVSNSAVEGEVNLLAHLECIAEHLGCRNDNDNVLSFCRNMQMHGGAHHFRNVDLCRNTLVCKLGVLGTDAEDNILRLNVVLLQALFLILAQLNLDAAKLCKVLVAFTGQSAVEHVHNRHADEACNKQVCRMIEHILRSADLLDITVTHDDNSVAQRHSFGLVMGNVDEGGVDTLTQLDDLSTHLVTELSVQVGERFVHQEDLRVTHDCTADCNTLSLTTGKCLRLTIEILGDVQNLSSLTDLFINDILLLLTELQGECHVFINRHMRVQSIVLENHCDISVFRCHIIHQFAVDVELTVRDLFQTCHHTQGRGFSAAGRADQNDEFLIGNIQIECLDSDNAFIRNLEIYLFLFRLVCFLFVLFLVLSAYERIHFFHVFELNSCHTFSAPAVRPPP